MYSRYLHDLICKHRPSCSFGSFDANFLFVLCTFSKFTDRRFSVCDFLVWNNLAIQLKIVQSLFQIKILSKAHPYVCSNSGSKLVELLAVDGIQSFTVKQGEFHF